MPISPRPHTDNPPAIRFRAGYCRLCCVKEADYFSSLPGAKSALIKGALQVERRARILLWIKAS